jgi:WD40 repeat protein
MSLQPLGGPLKNSIACAVQGSIIIFDITQSLATPKATWVAHEDFISLLKRNPFGISILSGSNSGAIHFWDLKNKPSGTPSIKFLKHTRAITGAEMLSDNNLLSSSADSFVMLWDIRNPTTPLRTFSPDDKSVLNIRLNPTKTNVAVATLKVRISKFYDLKIIIIKGLYTLSVQDYELMSLSPPERKVIFPDMCWDISSGRLYAGNMEGQIAVYNQINMTTKV